MEDTTQDQGKRLIETPVRIAHRYNQIIQLLGIEFSELSGKSPEESERIVKEAILELKSKRDEMDVIVNAGIMVTLAGKTYEIRQQSIEKDRIWRRELSKFASTMINTIMSAMKLDSTGQPQQVDNVDIVKELIPYVFGDGLDQAAEILFASSEELTAARSEILEKATSIEITEAALAAIEFAFPFVAAVVRGIVSLMSRAAAAGVLKPVSGQ